MDVSTPLYLALAFSVLAGIMSFLSPCVLAIVPMYVGYLSASTAQLLDEEKSSKSTLIINTICFVAGIGITFLLLGFAATQIGEFFSNQKDLFARIGGLIILVFGLVQLGFISAAKFEMSEKRLPFHFEKMSMNPGVAFLLGVFFSFSWTPCVGPILTSILILAGNAGTELNGILLIIAYTIGMAVPFLVLAFMAQQMLPYLKKHASVTQKIKKASGILLAIIGLVLLLNGGFDLPFGKGSVAATNAMSTSSSKSTSSGSNTKSDANKAVDFDLVDSEGNHKTLADYKGKIVVINFWATWCHFCVEEIPEINSLYHQLGENEQDVVILGVSPLDDSQDAIRGFLKAQGGEYPVMFDADNDAILRNYRIAAFPTTYIIDGEGNVANVIRGATNSGSLLAAINQAKNK